MATKKKASKRAPKKAQPPSKVNRLVAQKAVLGAQLRGLQAQIAKINADLARNGALDHVLLW